MTGISEIVDMIKKRDNTEEIIKIITSDFKYYNSLLLDGKLTVGHNTIETRTTFLGLAALYGNTDLVYGLLKEGVPADGLDFFLYRSSLYEDSNYRAIYRPNAPYYFLNQGYKYWSTITEIINIGDEFIKYIPWSTPVILAILSENAQCLKLLLDHGATCDLRFSFYADALSFCENEDVMKVLLEHPDTHFRENKADILIVFNLPLAKFLYNSGIAPEDNIVEKIKERFSLPPYTGFFVDYRITPTSKLWKDLYRKRAEELMEFYRSKGF